MGASGEGSDGKAFTEESSLIKNARAGVALMGAGAGIADDAANREG